MTALAERAILARLSVGVWSGKRIDREVTEEVNTQRKADVKDAGYYTKQLVAPRFFKDVTAVAGAATRIHKVMTLPWNDDGTRILSTTGHDEYTKQMRVIRLKFDAVAKQFAELMPDYIHEAKTRLADMFSADDYPTADEALDKFSFDIEFSKVPESNDFRAKLSDATTKAIVKDIEQRTNARVEQAMDDVYKRIFDATQHMAEKLRSYAPSNDPSSRDTFRDSLVYNINELADLIPCLNITGDQRLIDLQKRLKADLVEHSPEILRADPKARATTAKKAEKIAAKVKSYLG